MRQTPSPGVGLCESTQSEASVAHKEEFHEAGAGGLTGRQDVVALLMRIDIHNIG